MQDQTPTQPTVTPTLPEVSSSKLPDPDKTNAKWNWLIGIFTTLAVISLSIVFGGVLYLSSLVKSGVSGTEFMALLLIPFQLASLPIALISLTLAIIHLIKHQLSSRTKIFTIICLMLAGLITAFGVYGFISNIQGMQHLKQKENTFKQQLQQQSQLYAPHELEEQIAISLINNCQIHQFYYGPNQAVKDEVDAASKSKSGLVLVNSSEGKPWRITASQAEGTKLLPTANASRQKCGLPSINKDY
jgi:hypothetical protein